MKEHYVSYEQAIKLKELEFSGEVTGKYVDYPNDPTLFQGMLYQSWNLEPDEILAPRLDQVQAWLREVHNIDVEARIKRDGLVGGRKYNAHLCYKPTAYSVFYDMITKDTHVVDYDSYEAALSAGIDKAINLLNGEE